ncbi:MAG: serine/threonine-protein kinase [Candidatus Xenobia bacterium]
MAVLDRQEARSYQLDGAWVGDRARAQSHVALPRGAETAGVVHAVQGKQHAMEAFKPVMLLHESRYRDVWLLEEIAGGGRRAAHLLKLPFNMRWEQVEPRLAEVVARLPDLAPDVPAFHGLLHTEDARWLLFQYVEGPSLAHYPAGDVPTSWIVGWLAHMLATLGRLHAQGWTVGGFGPADWLVSNAQPRLVDPGFLEQFFPAAMTMVRSPFRRAMLAPEDRHAAVRSAAGDLYSAGAIGYWLLSGHPPGQGEARASSRKTPLLERPTDGRAHALMTLRPDLPQPAAEVMARLIQFKPMHRGSAIDNLQHLAPVIPPLDVDQAPAWHGWAPVPADEAGPQPVESHAPAPPALPDPPPGPLHEFSHELVWLLHSRPLLAVSSLALAGLILLMGVQHATRHSAPQPPPPLAMQVQSGSVVCRMASRWQHLHQVAAGTELSADGRDDSVLAWNGGHLVLQSTSTAKLLGLAPDQVSLQLEQGTFQLDAGTVRWKLSCSGNTVDCLPGSKLQVVVGGARSTLQVDGGTVAVGTRSVTSGQSITLTRRSY